MAEQFSFKAEIQQLLDILIHSLYTDREIFLRELISNASDALTRVQFESLTNSNLVDAGAELYIEITPDEEAGTLTISDSGIGMTREEMVENLGVIAHSGAKAFVQKLKEQQAAGGQDVIGQFGVGFYSVFMVADKVRVVSRSAHPEAQAFAWESNGSDTYTIEPSDRETRGTDIIITVKEDAKDFLKTWKLSDIVRRHSDYIAYPIYVGEPKEGEEQEAVNKQVAIWRQESKEVTDEQYDEFYKMLTFDWEKPVHHIHMRADVPLQFYALLYVPAGSEANPLMGRREPGLKLYARKVLIQDNTTELLPDYLNFVAGVVDSEDLPLSVSRETVQATRVMANLKKTITNKVLNELKRLQKNKPEVYHQIFEAFGRHIKQGVVVSPGEREDIEPLLMFPSTKTASADEWITLQQYVERMAENQTDIYYVIGDDYASATRSPHLDAFRQRGIEVLYFVDPVDPVLIMGLSEFSGHKLRAADEADIDLSNVGAVSADEEAPRDALPEDQFTGVQERFKAVLGERVTDVKESKNLVGSPARLVTSDHNPTRNMFRINRLMDRDYELPVKALELNPRHPLIYNLSGKLAADPQNPIIDAVIEQVFETALLQDGIHPDPASMAARLYQLMQAATE
ncbi:MAG: molecular chaperone HtpG [Chloroflexi bacterium]|uniref:molecular chaperone HtpG n=1 Tax=Candidatus Flexifilum breve TaxID=3140694 RepID=UPI003136A3E1|nr:molecular chaperone HtpG [Chloroflexota bacterium]